MWVRSDPRRISPSDRTRDAQLVKATTRAATRRCDQHDREGDHRADGESDHKGLPPTPAGSSFGHLCISNRHATLPPISSRRPYRTPAGHLHREEAGRPLIAGALGEAAGEGPLAA
jgi:hypothetical protein